MRRIATIAAFVFIIEPFSALLTAATPGCGSGRTVDSVEVGEPVVEFGKRLSEGTVIPPNQPSGRQVYEYLSDGTRYLRPRIELVVPTELPWYLMIRDDELRTVQVLGPEDFRKKRSLWAARVPGARAILELVTKLGDEAPTLRVPEYVAVPRTPRVTYYSAADPQNPSYRNVFGDQGAQATDPVRRWADSSGLLLAGYADKSWCCSGVLVADGLFLTNWHCGGPETLDDRHFWNDDIRDGIVIDLSWDQDATSRDLVATRVVDSSRELDFALLAVEPLGATTAGIGMPIAARSLVSGEALTVLHHPECDHLKYSQGGSCVVEATTWQPPAASRPVGFTHRCDTASGSSGGAVLDAKGNLVGLHHMGYLVLGDGSCDRVNKAIQISEIVRHIERRAPEAFGKLRVAFE